ncbi:MAG: hypothetical protein NZ578_16290 [Candidatus Binatia bacterium]|nr:hypothetical protein [Candidatus Binatia bacterium]
MLTQLSRVMMTLGCLLFAVPAGEAQVDPGAVGNLGTLGPLGLGVSSGRETIPGAVLVKITGEVQCRPCTLEELGLEDTPGDLYQFSQDTNHLVIKVTKATPDFTWDMVERHKLFLTPGEDPTPLHRLLSESKPGRRIQITGGVAPEEGRFVPLQVTVD